MYSIICKNCNHHFKGNFCPHCGQSAKVEPIGIKYFLHDIPHSILHIDKGFWYTFKSLFSSPGKALAQYLAGQRIRHFRPFAYLLILSAVYVFLNPFIERLAGYIAGHQIYSNWAERPFFEHYISLLLILLVPFLSLVTWVVFKKAAYNYWEHFLVNIYMAAQTNVFLLGIKLFGLLKISLGWSADVNFTLAMVIFMFYYSFTFVKLMLPFYKPKHVTWRLFIMNFLLATIYMTGFSLSGIMTPWWGK